MLVPCRPSQAMQIAEGYVWGNQRDSKNMLAYEAPKKILPALSQHGPNVDIKDGLNAIRKGGEDTSAVVVGSTGIQLDNPVQHGQGTFTWTIRKSKSNDGLGIYVGIADGQTDFLSNCWGKAWAMGCHSCNLFEWNDACDRGQIIYGGLPGSAESLTDGSTITVKVDLSASPRTLSFSINGGDFITADGCELPTSVRPFCKLAGFDGDAVTLTYDDVCSRTASLDSTQKDLNIADVTEKWNRTERITPDSITSFLA